MEEKIHTNVVLVVSRGGGDLPGVGLKFSQQLGNKLLQIVSTKQIV